MIQSKLALGQARHAWQNELTRRHFNRSGETGGTFEREVLGECLVGCDGYMKFKSAMKLAERNQPYETNNPPPVVSTFHRAVADRMGINPRDLHVFTAVRTPLDRYHGIDGWFRWRNHIVTVDVTKNLHKDEPIKARVLVTEADAAFGYMLAADEIAYAFKCMEQLGRRTGVV